MCACRKFIPFLLVLTVVCIFPVHSPGTHLISRSYPLGESSSVLQKMVEWQTVQIVNYDWRGNEISSGAGVFVNGQGMVVTAIDVLEGGTFAEVITVTGESYFVEDIVSVDRESGLVLFQLDAVPDSFKYVESVAGLPTQADRVIFATAGPNGKVQAAWGEVTDLNQVPVYSYFSYVEMSQSLFGRGCPVFNTQGELAGIAVAWIEKGNMRAVVVSGRKVLSLERDRENPRAHADWAESERLLWRESPGGQFLYGLASYLAGDYRRARPLLENAVAHGKGLSEETYYFLGNCYESEDLHRLAIEAYTNALKFNPSSARVYENLAWSRMKAGEPEDALEACYRAVINEGGSKFRAYLLMARVRNSIGDFQAAVTAALGALNYDPASPSAYNEMGIAYNSLGMYDEAVAALLKATSLDPLYGEAFNNLGHAYLRSDRPFHAIIVLKHAAAIQTEYSAALKNLGEAYSVSGQHLKALEAYRMAVGMCPDDPFTFSRLASEYAKAGDLQQAATIYQYGIKYMPESAWLHYKLGRIYCMAGRMAAARGEHYLLARLNPNLADQLRIWIERLSDS